MTPHIDKNLLLAQIKARLAAEIGVLQSSVAAAREAATHEEAKPENKYDTRGLEASYLAGAQAQRLGELEAQLQGVEGLRLRAFGEIDPVQLTALVEVDAAGTSARYFLMTVGAGFLLSSPAGPVVTVTPQSPLGRALIGKRVDDWFSVGEGDGKKEYVVTGVS